MYYPKEVIDEVQSRNDIVDVISGYIQIKRSGSGYMGLCPFHNEKSGSFSVNPSGQYYHCFGCGKSGNVFTFLMEYEKLEFPEALQRLADKAGVKLPEAEYSAEQKAAFSRKQKLFEVNKEAATFYYKQLRGNYGELGMKYFTERGLTKEIMQQFGLGYSLQYTDALLKTLKQKGYNDEILRASGLFTVDKEYGDIRDKFINRVMFPIQDMNGKVIGFGGRVLGDGKPKYLNSPETDIFDKSNNLYGFNFARASRKDQIILCEGYMDVIAMHQAGFNQAAASLGTAFTIKQAFIIKRYTHNVFLAYDSDMAGVTAAIRNIGILRAAGLGCKIIDMRPYKDPDEFIKNLGAEEFQKRIDSAENSFLFEIRQLKEQFNLEDPTEKTDFHRGIAEKLCQFEDELERNNYTESICKIYEIAVPAMERYIRDHASKGIAVIPEKPKSGTDMKKKEEEPYMITERTLLTYIVDDPSIYSKIKDYITPEDFIDDIYKTVAGVLFEQIDAGQVNPASIINTYTDAEEQSKVAGVFECKLAAIDTREEKNKALNDLVLSLKSNSFNYSSQALKSDMTAIKKLMEMKKSLEKLRTSKILFY